MNGASKLPLGTGTFSADDPAMRSLHTAAVDAVGTGGHCAFDEQLLWSIEHCPGVKMFGHQVKSKNGGKKPWAHGLPSTLHVPPCRGQYAGWLQVESGERSQYGSYDAPEHASPVIEQWLPAGAQPASPVQASVVSMLQWPASVGQFASVVHAVATLEQVPGTVGHSPSAWQTEVVIEHWPLGGQSPGVPLTWQTLASRLHVPFTVGQLASTVHAALVTVQ